MASSCQKTITNEATGPNSSSEESERKGRKPHRTITLPIFEKKTIQEAKLWWRRFIQYVKMTRDIDLNNMTTDKEILPEFREELGMKIKDIFIWALGEAAVTEMTKTVRDKDPNKMNVNQLYALFRLHFIPERSKFHCRADLFGITREPNESAEDVWTRILQTEKNCEFDRVTPAELIASKFLSLIGRSTGDYELKKKIRKSDMTKETITDLIREYMYDRLNDSNISNNERDVKHVQERPQKKWQEKPVTRKTKEDRSTTKNGTKITDATIMEHQTGQDNIYVPPNPLNAETLEREDNTKRCAVYLKEYSMWIKQHHQRKKITGIMTISRK